MQQTIEKDRTIAPLIDGDWHPRSHTDGQFGPRDCWVEDYRVPMVAGGNLHELEAGIGVTSITYSSQLFLSGVDGGLCSTPRAGQLTLGIKQTLQKDLGAFIREQARLLDRPFKSNSGMGRTLMIDQVNGASNSAVYLCEMGCIGSYNPICKFVLTAGEEPAAIGRLRDQYVTLRFFHQYYPNRTDLAEPYLESMTDTDVYLYTSQYRPGTFELVQQNQQFFAYPFGEKLQPVKTALAPEIRHQVACMVSTLFGSTYDPSTTTGFLPTRLSFVNGDMVIEPAEESGCKVSFVCLGEKKEIPIEYLVAMLLAPRDVHRGGTFLPENHIFTNLSSDHDEIRRAMVTGLQATFEGQTETVVDRAINRFAEEAVPTYERVFESIKRRAREDHHYAYLLDPAAGGKGLVDIHSGFMGLFCRLQNAADKDGRVATATFDEIIAEFEPAIIPTI